MTAVRRASRLLALLEPEPDAPSPGAFLGLALSPARSRACGLAAARSGALGAAALRRDDLRLAGVVASVVIESELLAFLSGLPREAPGPVRNGYAQRRVRTVDGVMPFLSARERSGRFEPQLIARYARSTRVAPADLLAFATAEGYSGEELRRLLSNAYAASGAVPERLDDILARTRGRLAPWVAAPAEGCPRLVAGGSGTFGMRRPKERSRSSSRARSFLTPRAPSRESSPSRARPTRGPRSSAGSSRSSAARSAFARPRSAPRRRRRRTRPMRRMRRIPRTRR